MSEFIKPALPDRLKKKQLQLKPALSDKSKKKQSQSKSLEPVIGPERLVVRAKMPNTPGFWFDLMVGNSAFKSYNDSFRLTCLCAMQQREKNDVPRQKVYWDHLLDEAEWLRQDFREERVWMMGEAKKRAEQCVKEWKSRMMERGRFVENGELVWSAPEYWREGLADRSWEGEFSVRVREAEADPEGKPLGKRKRDSASQGGENVPDRVKRPRTLRRFSCDVVDSI